MADQARQMAAQTLEKADQVDPNIFISGYLIAADPNFVQRNGITRIVKMFADDPTYEGGYHRHPGVTYFVAAADDVPGYDIRRNAADAMKFIKEGLAKNERILVHCHAGISRSSTVVLMHLMVNRGLPLDIALERLQRIRPVVQPNSGFMRHLRATDARIRRLRRRMGGKAPVPFPLPAAAAE